MAAEEEIASTLGKQGVTNIRIISVRKGEERTQTNIYIRTFNQPRTPKEVKIGYCLERAEQYVLAPTSEGASNAKNMHTIRKTVEDE